MTVFRNQAANQILWLKASWEKIKYPVLLLLLMRIGYTCWFALIGFIVDPYLPATEEWIKHGYLLFPGNPTIVGRIFLDVWIRWDAVNFLHIATTGYTDSYYFAFYPLFPSIVKILSSLFRFFNFPTSNLIFSGLLISTVATGFSLINFRILILEYFHKLDLANWTILIWLLFPTSFFLFAPFSDALYISLAIATLVALKRRKWILAGLLASLAGLARAQGILLTIPFALTFVEFLRENDWRWELKRKEIPIFTISIILSIIGWLVFFLWSHNQISTDLFGNYSSYWGSTVADPITVLIHSIKFIWKSGNFRAYSELINIFLFGFLITWMLVKQEYRNNLALVGYSLVTFLSFVVWYTESESGYLSSNRYVLSLFPAYIALTDIVLRLPERFRHILILSSVVTLMVTTVLYVFWLFIG